VVRRVYLMNAGGRNRIKNPLRIRVLREFRIEWRKYIVIFIFLTLMIGFISGVYVANNSMLIATEEVKTSGIREDGHFILKEKADAELTEDIESGEKVNVRAYYVYDAYKDISTDDIRDAFRSGDYHENLEDLYDEADRKAHEDYENAVGDFDLDDPYFRPVPVRIFENFRKDTDEDIDGDGTRDSGIRVYINRDDINTYCLMEGEDADSADEIVIDRMHADNNGISVGDKLSVGGEEFTVVGLAAFPNYSTLHEKSTDMMFDALTFDVAMTTQEGWDRIKAGADYEYAWLYENSPADVKEEKKLADNFLKALITQAAFNDNEITDYVPEYSNQAIQFAPDDVGSDKAMAGVVLYILIVVLAFIFAVTESNTIAKEAPVIGTLRASGYTRRELTLNYMAAPVIVTLLGALAGNILGYSYFKNVVVSMYYNSYSLPQYETVWTPDAFVRTTVIPVILMLFINWFIIRRKMRFSPLRFLRGDLKTIRRRRALKLPDISFIKRFRIRIFLQNLPGYFMLFAGIFFVMVMLAMAVGMPTTLSWYQEHAGEMMLSKYQTVLTSDHDEDGVELVTSAAGAEKFSMEELVYVSGGHEESINAYGVTDGSRYAAVPEGLAQGEICISTAMSGKFDIEEGDIVKIKQKYGFDSYEFTVRDIIRYDGAVAVFMDNDNFNETFDREEGSFDGYFSDEEVKDIDEDYVAAVITEEDITKMAAQLDHSMGAYMLYFQYLCILLSAVLIYLLTKVIVERNEKSISMVKILGYTDREVAGLYLVTTTIAVIVSELIAVFASKSVMTELWKAVLARMGGYYPFMLTPQGMLRMGLIVFAGYMIVLLIDFRRIRRIPMDEALKDME